MTKSADLPLVTLHSAFPIGIGCPEPLRGRDLGLNNPSFRVIAAKPGVTVAEKIRDGDHQGTAAVASKGETRHLYLQALNLSPGEHWELHLTNRGAESAVSVVTTDTQRSPSQPSTQH